MLRGGAAAVAAATKAQLQRYGSISSSSSSPVAAAVASISSFHSSPDVAALALPRSSEAYRTTASLSDALKHYGRCYWELSKARLSALVVATSGAGFVLGSGNAIDFTGLCCTCAGTMMVAAAANSLNQVFEIQNDARMKRTMRRPLPSGRITLPHAVVWASGVGLAGTSLLALKVVAG